jgi:Holliday junction resolvase RusA-like endonuclease
VFCDPKNLPLSTMTSESVSRVEFTVLGEPQPQGSKTIVQARGRRPRVIEDNPDTVPWRNAVAAAALAAIRQASAGSLVLTGPVELRAVFVFQRPKGHFGTGRNAGTLKPSSPLYVPKRPDLDKLLRAVGDALTGIVFRDDSQIVICRAEKHYGQPACAHVIVEQLALDDDRPAPEVA